MIMGKSLTHTPCFKLFQTADSRTIGLFNSCLTIMHRHSTDEDSLMQMEIKQNMSLAECVSVNGMGFFLEKMLTTRG